MTQAANIDVDVIVLGAGAAGMTAALVAANEGLSVLLVEKSEVLGGSTAYSGGVCWVPRSHLARRAGVQDSEENVWTYVSACLGEHMDEASMRRYLSTAPEAFEYLEENSEVAFLLRETTPDYSPELPGGTLGGRALEILEYDARRLGKNFAHLRRPPDEYLVLGGMMVTVGDANRILARYRSLDGFRHTVRLVWRYLMDRITLNPRGTRLVIGNAMVARLYASLLKRKVPVWRNAQVQSLVHDTGRVCGAEILHEGKRHSVVARKGVVLATGGFPRNASMRRQFFADGAEINTSVPESSTGDGISLALSSGAAMGKTPATPAFWSPASKVMRRDGSSFNFPHLMMDRSKPGVIAVNQAGARFVNESTNYHDFTQAMLRQVASAGSAHAYLVSTQSHLDKYCFGMSHPDRGVQNELVRRGYLFRGDTPAALAGRIGVPAEALQKTIEDFNAQAVQGADPAFGKGSTAYNRALGDPEAPHPCLAPLEAGPYYAIRMVPGDIGTCHGLSTDLDGRVLNSDGAVIPGLYACGNDMNSVMGGMYPGPGITLGPALAFGYAVARHIARQAA